MGAALRGGELVGPLALAQQAGNAEVEEFDGAVGGDEDVAGLEVAVDDEVLVGVLDGGADLAQELEALGDAEALRGGVAGDGDAVHVLHHDVGLPRGGDAAVEEGGDVLVGERGEDLAFVAEAADGEVALQAAAQELEGDALVELGVGADALVDRPHPPHPQQPHHLVRPDPRPDRRLVLVAQRGGQHVPRRALPPVVGAIQRRQERLHLGAQRVVRAAGARHEGVSLGRVHLERGIEQRPHLLHPCRGQRRRVSHRRLPPPGRASGARRPCARASPSAPPAAPPPAGSRRRRLHAPRPSSHTRR